MQEVPEAIKTSHKIKNNISLNRDLGKYSLNGLYPNLIRNDLTKYLFLKPVDINTEPVTNKRLRLASKKQDFNELPPLK